MALLTAPLTRRLTLLLALGLLIGGGVRAQRDDDAPAWVRVVHLAPKVGAVTVTLEGDDPLVFGVSTDTISTWDSLAPADQTIRVIAPDNDDAVLLEQRYTFAPNTWTTLVLIGTPERDSFRVVVLPEDTRPIPADSARVTVMHAVENADPIDVIADATVLMIDLAYPGRAVANDGAFTVDLAAAQYDVQVWRSEDFGPPDVPPFDDSDQLDPRLGMVNLPNLLFASNTHYFIGITGLPRAMRAIIAASDLDATTPDGTPIPTATETPPASATAVPGAEASASADADADNAEATVEPTSAIDLLATVTPVTPTLTPSATLAVTATATATPILEIDQSERTLYDVVAANPDLSTLRRAIDAAGMTEALQATNDIPLTLFAPTNAAFESLLVELDTNEADLFAQTEQLADLLNYHVLPGDYSVRDLQAITSGSMYNGKPVRVAFIDGRVYLNDTVALVPPGVRAANGYVHVTDAALLPPLQNTG